MSTVRLPWRLIPFVACFLALAGLPGVGSAKDFLWRVRSNNGVVYLAGSFHRLRESDASAPPFPIASFEQAFQQSHQVVFESNPDPVLDAALEGHFVRKAFYSPGESIRSVLSGTTYQRLRNVLVSGGVPGRVVDRMKPWYAASVLSDVFADRLGFETEHGIDDRYHDLAVAQGKPRLYLESPYEHINVIAATPQSEWAAGFPAALNDRGRSIFSALEIYKAGDVTALTRSINRSAVREPGITRGLLVKRNQRWLPKIEAYLQQNQTTMVVVGAAHMVRSSGLVALLRNRGYEAVQLPEDALVSSVESAAVADP
jgi:uncharacterized protein YbaP (TraB family)